MKIVTHTQSCSISSHNERLTWNFGSFQDFVFLISLQDFPISPGLKETSYLRTWGDMHTFSLTGCVLLSVSGTSLQHTLIYDITRKIHIFLELVLSTGKAGNKKKKVLLDELPSYNNAGFHNLDFIYIALTFYFIEKTILVNWCDSTCCWQNMQLLVMLFGIICHFLSHSRHKVC